MGAHGASRNAGVAAVDGQLSALMQGRKLRQKVQISTDVGNDFVGVGATEFRGTQRASAHFQAHGIGLLVRDGTKTNICNFR
jgi:hypothetical protein